MSIQFSRFEVRQPSLTGAIGSRDESHLNLLYFAVQEDRARLGWYPVEGGLRNLVGHARHRFAKARDENQASIRALNTVYTPSLRFQSESTRLRGKKRKGAR